MVARITVHLASFLLIAVSVLHTVVNPYTKVEESFTIQAVHDILANGIGKHALSRYDHQVFPGAVPRSFIGPLLLATASYPWILLGQAIGLVKTSAHVQIVVRLVLSMATSVSLIMFARCFFDSHSKDVQSLESHQTTSNHDTNESATSSSIRVSASAAHQRKRVSTTKTETKVVAHSLLAKADTVSKNTTEKAYFLLLSASQFHVNFWSGRTIPNSVAFPFVLCGISLLLGTRNPNLTMLSVQHRCQAALYLLTFSAVVLRLEIFPILGASTLWILATRKLSFCSTLLTGMYAGVFSLFMTFFVDTYFWQPHAVSKPKNILTVFLGSIEALERGTGRPMWPELEAVVFNVVQGKSSEWGISPWHSYLSSFIPKLLSFSIPLLFLGLVTIGGRQLSPTRTSKANLVLLFTCFQIGALSLLGHKEWRFMAYCIPGLNAISSMGAYRLLKNDKKRLGWLVRLVPIVIIVVHAINTIFAAFVSHFNYPGGVALSTIHEALDHPSNWHKQVRIHIDVLPAMTGVTLFQSLYLNRPAVSKSNLLSSPFPPPRPNWTEWVYEKTEDLPKHGEEARLAWQAYTHIITEAEGCDVLQTFPSLDVLHLSFDQKVNKAVPLEKEKQPFQQLLPAIQGYDGIKTKSIGQVKSDLRLAVKTASKLFQTRSIDTLKQSSIELLRYLVPIQIKMKDQVWICVRKN